MRHGEPDRVAAKPVPVPDLEIDPRVEHVIQRIPAAAVLIRAGITTWTGLRALTGADLHTAGVKGASKVALIDLANLKSHHNEPARPEPQWAVDMMAAPKVELSDCAICAGTRLTRLEIREPFGAPIVTKVPCACVEPDAVARKLADYPKAVRYRTGFDAFTKLEAHP